MNHNITIERLLEYQVLEWLLKLIASYFEERTMQVKYRGHTSTSKYLPGSSPKRTLLGLLLFILTTNETFMTFEPFPEKIDERDQHMNQDQNNDEMCRAKFVDDVTAAEAVTIEKLTPKMNARPNGPLLFDDTSDLELSPSDSLIQKELNAKDLRTNLQMILNADKTKKFV